MRRDQLVGVLEKVPLFSALSKKDLGRVARITERSHAAAGEVIIRQGELGREFFVVAEGTATVTQRGKKVRALGPGDFFGELALLDPSRRNATVVADGPVELLVLDDRDFRGLLETVPSVGRGLLVGLARRIHDLDAESVR
jgi:CRP-like cAMP-binding protein